jgi:NTP pyrophosphatase (non-canonical NTP hydrolase)
MYSTQHLAVEVYAWAQQAFPDRTLGSMALKMYEEIGEMLKDPRDPLEFADVMILLLDHAVRHGINIEDAVQRKLIINRQRSWKVNASGAMSHEE